MSHDSYKTAVIGRVRAIGYEPDPDLDKAAADAAQKEYEIATGELPRKAYRQKVTGGGSHLAAVYPDWFVARIDKIVNDTAAALGSVSSQQKGLFDG